MEPSVAGKVYSLKLSQIDAEDRTFAISPAWLFPQRLLESVRQAGILSPLQVVATHPGRFRIVSGFQRYRAADRVGLASVPCLLQQPGSSELDLFLRVVRENQGTRPLLEVEKASVLRKLKERFLLSDRELIEQFQPLLGIRSDRHSLKRYLQLSRLPEQLQRSLPSLRLEMALKIAAWMPEEQSFLLGVLERYHPGKNKQKELFELLDELRATLRRDPVKPAPSRPLVPRIWQESGAAEIDQDSGLARTEQLDKIISRLRLWRYPVLCRLEDRYRKLKRALALPAGIQLNAPRFFEGDRMAIRFMFRTPEELRGAGRKLQEIAEKKELKEIFELL
ncbi:MAG: ParB/RepB/Spo0J family partition protein [Acidobacteriota bacterium]